MKTVGEWRDEWLKDYGKSDEIEVVIMDNKEDVEDVFLYEGSFFGIPCGFFNKRVLQIGRIVASSVAEREGAYSFMV